MRILFVARELQHPPIGGARLRIENTLKALSRISEVHLYSLTPPIHMGGAEAMSFYGSCCRSTAFSPSAVPRGIPQFVERAVNLTARGIAGRNMIGPRRQAARDIRHLLRRARSVNADAIWLANGTSLYQFLPHIKNLSDCRVVVDTALVRSRFVLRGLPYAKTVAERDAIEEEGKQVAQEERWGTEMADVTTAVSQVDADYYRELAPDPGRVRILSNVIDLEDYRSVPPCPAGLTNPCIYLAGTFFSPNCPMVDATHWLVSEVLPLVRRQIPDIRLFVVGGGSDRFLASIKDTGVAVIGRVPSVLPYLCHADVAVVPLRFESGTRFKILEAGVCGIPVVSTTLGAEGLAVTPGRDVLIADSADTFADSIAAVVGKPAYGKSLGANLRSLVTEKYSVDSLTNEAYSVLDCLRATQSGPRVSTR